MANNTIKIEKTTKLFLGIFALLLFVGYAFTSFGIMDVSGLYTPLIGLFLALVILLEIGVNQYFNSSKLRNLTGRDFVNFAALLVAGVILALSIAQFGILPADINSAIVDRLGFIGGITALIGAGIVVILMLI